MGAGSSANGGASAQHEDVVVLVGERGPTQAAERLGGGKEGVARLRRDAEVLFESRASEVRVRARPAEVVAHRDHHGTPAFVARGPCRPEERVQIPVGGTRRAEYAPIAKHPLA